MVQQHDHHPRTTPANNIYNYFLFLYLSLWIAAYTTSLLDARIASWMKDASFAFKVMAAPLSSNRETALACPSLAERWSAVFLNKKTYKTLVP